MAPFKLEDYQRRLREGRKPPADTSPSRLDGYRNRLKGLNEMHQRVRIRRKTDGPKLLMRIVIFAMILAGIGYLSLTTACKLYTPPRYHDWQVKYGAGQWRDMSVSEECTMNFIEMIKRGEWRLTKRNS